MKKSRFLVLMLGLAVLAPRPARCQGAPAKDVKPVVSQEQKIDDGMGALLKADPGSLNEALGQKVENAQLRRGIAGILDFFRARDSQLDQKASGERDAAPVFGASFAALDSKVAANALRGLRLQIHSAMKAAAEKYGLKSCPFEGAQKASPMAQVK